LGAVEELGRRHLTYGVRQEHYATVGAAVLWTLQTGLGDAFTLEVREAWTCAYLFLSSTMQQGGCQCGDRTRLLGPDAAPSVKSRSDCYSPGQPKTRLAFFSRHVISGYLISSKSRNLLC
jgi:Globin